MTLDLSGKNALVTGGSRGIGRAIVEALARAGANVAFTYRSSADSAEQLQADLDPSPGSPSTGSPSTGSGAGAGGATVLAIQSDAADFDAAQETVQQVLDAWGSLDVLVNNAGVTRDNLLIRMSEADWDAVIGTNLKSVFNLCKAAYRPMMKQRAGSIVNISSVVGVTGNPGQANYAASKAGIIGFTKSLARELGGRGVRANVVAPGYVDTDMTDALSDAAKEAMTGSIPLGRTARPEDVANAVLFLASDAGAYVTGHVLHVDGGLAM